MQGDVTHNGISARLIITTESSERSCHENTTQLYYREFHLPEYEPVRSLESHPTFRGITQPPFPEYKNKSIKKPARNLWQRLFCDSENGVNIFLQRVGCLSTDTAQCYYP
jgi:hypothetical protein